MSISIPIYPHRNRKWFFVRKGLFQLMLPGLLVAISWYDWLMSETGEPVYSSLYCYIAAILFGYAGIIKVLKYLFTICADNIVFKKPIDLEKTVPNIVLANDLETGNAYQGVIVIKKLFKLRYSSSIFFVKITQACWFLGLDCPILIPWELIKDLDIDYSDDNLSLHTTIDRIYNFQPSVYNLVGDDVNKQVILKSQQSICDVKRGLFES